MAHEFTFKIDGELVTYTEWENIPDKFDHVIKFLPDVPHDHDSPDIWSPRLQELIKRETNARSN